MSIIDWLINEISRIILNYYILINISKKIKYHTTHKKYIVIYVRAHNIPVKEMHLAKLALKILPWQYKIENNVSKVDKIILQLQL